MSDLTTRGVKNRHAGYMTMGNLYRRAEPDAEFDTWLARVKAEAWEEGANAQYRHDVLSEQMEENPYRTSSDALPGGDRG